MKLRFALFVSIILLVLVGVHLYLWARLVRDTGLPHPWRRLISTSVVALGVSLLGGMIVQRLLPLQATRVMLFPVFVWMGLLFLLLTLLMSADLIWLSLRVASYFRRGGDLDPTRRLFLSRLVGSTVAGAALGLTVFSSRSALALARVATQRIEVPLRRLPRRFDGFRIVQLSDLHVGPTLGRTWLEGIIQRVNALRPDLIAITGDMVDGTVEQIGSEVLPLRQLSARHGVFCCTGNHEYYSGAVEWCNELTRLGLRVLRNERVPIAVDDDVAFDLVGIDDFNAEGLAPGHGADLATALAGRDPARELVLLAHQPRAIFEAAERGVGLQLSGHTHGGQLWPMHWFVRLQQPYLAGLVRHGATHLYVNQGTGFWGPPMRLGSQAEVTEIVLRAMPADARTPLGSVF